MNIAEGHVKHHVLIKEVLLFNQVYIFFSLMEQLFTCDLSWPPPKPWVFPLVRGLKTNLEWLKLLQNLLILWSTN